MKPIRSARQVVSSLRGASFPALHAFYPPHLRRTIPTLTALSRERDDALALQASRAALVRAGRPEFARRPVTQIYLHAKRDVT